MMDSTTDPFYNQHHIISWLDACEKPAPNAIPGQGKLPPTPAMSSSPGKRKRSRKSDGRGNGDGDGDAGRANPRHGRDCDDDDVHQNPRLATQTAKPPLAQPTLACRALASSSVSFSSSKSAMEFERSRGSRRSTSPIKSAANLKFLAKPVYFKTFSPGQTLSQLPPDVHDLYSRIKRLTEYRMGFVPAAARGIIQKKELGWPDHWFRPEIAEEHHVEEFGPWVESDTELEGGKEVGRLLAQRQFRALRSITDAANQSAKQRRGELAWNNLVHSRLLRHAASFPNSGVAYEPIMSASIANQWLPEMANQRSMSNVKEVASGETVDFAFVLDLHDPRPADRALAEAVLKAVGTQADDSLSVNQTMYEPLVFKPIGVSISTALVENGDVKLGIWTAAWHRRISELLPVPPGGIVTLPLLLCQGYAWNLYFACDRGSEIEILGPISLGGTHDLPSTYSLFSALQELCRWVDGPFRRWLVTMLGVAGPGESGSVAGTGD
ncbi:hypothetical protein RB595_005091 [Gaeumannomyces hyphopodioides]